MSGGEGWTGNVRQVDIMRETEELEKLRNKDS